MGRDERCNEYLVWQFLFDCADWQNADDARRRSPAPQAIDTNVAEGAKALALGKMSIDMDQTSR